MAFDASLAARVRKALAGRTDVVEKSMFGGLTFMVAGKMCCGVLKDELMVRLSPAAALAELKSRHARVCDFTRRPMPGFFIVGAQGCRDQRSVAGCVRLALKYVLSLPSK
jgi:TfoX/Sxy family transcriptional regulator of competence genes